MLYVKIGLVLLFFVIVTLALILCVISNYVDEEAKGK